MVGFVCLAVEVGLMDVVTPGSSMALSGMGGRVGGEGYSRYAFPILHLSLDRIVNVCVCPSVLCVCCLRDRAFILVSQP